eukprot:gb/GECH01011568.1/.p1 GENE.gb/GECH01011568.1/~~gb/GECH01011568.1/.p1  ORF type:complete len:329 (+),score=53.97 gb/GECH01011568.1/:1-987(+)
MKLATIDNNTRDGQLVVVSRDGSKCVGVPDIASCMQVAIDNWDQMEPKLREVYNRLNSGEISDAQPVDISKLHSPFPRAYEWIDGSAYINHIILVRKARNAEPPETLRTDPLVYQGGSGTFLRPTQDIAHYSEEYGIDFEAEICVVTDDVPMGTSKEDAEKHIKLLTLCNDVTLRKLIPAELKKGFGFFNAKPSTSFSPFAITPDELGDTWKEGRVHLPLETRYNGNVFGNPEAGPEMHFSFHDLVEHAAKTRSLTAGSIIGSGTVSNEDRSRGSSCLAEKRMLEKIDTGEFKTPFMKFGDHVEIDMKDKSGSNIFGTISQNVVQQKK